MARKKPTTAAQFHSERVDDDDLDLPTGGGCGCSARQKWLNEWGNKVQYKARDAMRAAEKFYFGE